MKKFVVAILGAFSLFHSNVSFADQEELFKCNECLDQFAVMEVIKIQHWKDCDIGGFSFWLNDGSCWYSVSDYLYKHRPLFKVAVGQKIGIIPMTDEEAKENYEVFGVFHSRPYWVILHPQENSVKVDVGYRIN